MNSLIIRTRVFGLRSNERIAVVLNNDQYRGAIGVHSGMRLKTANAFTEYLACGMVIAPLAPYTISVNAQQFEKLKELAHGQFGSD